ncbi:MerR family transcriptional regulator [Aeromicrobium sp. 50.2.37]|uniref:transcriptional regulator FtsR n=1 Tax=Aeromicrobium sp. 50.2.37 TaxID=2969305 RepID=UPI00214FBC9C|nr:MerR family transcriptional regulator [Aeromicrobium sp. 50.2.37]MCR4514896.1 MerR family transcriptional regulator [Aeromicrobium sp. 50.2.37]
MTQPLPELARLGIGKVLAELREEFPSLTISKIRYLEREGLLEPERTPSGYRKFSFDDVERLRFVLRQQKRYWPLSAIRQALDEMDRGLVPQTDIDGNIRVPDVSSDADGLPTPAAFLEGRSRVRLSRAEVLESSGATEELLEQVEQHGLLTRRPGQSAYDGDDLVVVDAVVRLASLGVEPRHLRAVVTAAERESDLLARVVPERRRREDKAAAAEQLGELAALTMRLHTVLLRHHLRD